LAEIVQDNQNGLHFDPGNPEDLAAKISMLESEPELANRLGANARETYLNNYTPEKNYHKLMHIYMQVTLLGVSD
jgi:glycosyltransferase involved in cell wall biosynthesis